MSKNHTLIRFDDVDDVSTLVGDDAIRNDCHGSHHQNTSTPHNDQCTPLSQERLDADRTATKQDVMEATDKIPPLLMRYCPDGTHCIATWNVNNCFYDNCEGHASLQHLHPGDPRTLAFFKTGFTMSQPSAQE